MEKMHSLFKDPACSIKTASSLIEKKTLVESLIDTKKEFNFGYTENDVDVQEASYIDSLVRSDEWREMVKLTTRSQSERVTLKQIRESMLSLKNSDNSSSPQGQGQGQDSTLKSSNKR